MADASLAHVQDVSRWFSGALRPAIDNLSMRIEPGRVTGLVGPDAAGKTTLMRLLAALLLPTSGTITVCGHPTTGDVSPIRNVVSYMPQRFGLYEDLSVAQNLNLYADLSGVVGEERREALNRLLEFTRLAPFTNRLAGRLSGGMKQKLGLACALVRRPLLLLLDEPSAGVDPISRRELWSMVYDLTAQGIGVVWSTSYLDEAERCAQVLLINDGQALYDGPPAELTARAQGRTYLVATLGTERRQILARGLRQPGVVDGVIQGSNIRLVMASGAAPDAAVLGTSAANIVATAPRFEDAFIDLLGGSSALESPFASLPRSAAASTVVIEAIDLTKRFGSFVAADSIRFTIARGEIYGLLGPNGAGKSTTFRMISGMLRPTSGRAFVAGKDLYRGGGTARRLLGYMAQKFSLYGDLSVRQNLRFFGGIYGLARGQLTAAVMQMTEIFGLGAYLDRTTRELPIGYKQRLALACAVIHSPHVLFLDEPTSGVDPITRREFWAHINALAEQGVTVMVTTHFMDEAEYCDRIGLVYGGRIIAEGSPDALKEIARSHPTDQPTLEEAFITLVNRSGDGADAA